MERGKGMQKNFIISIFGLGAAVGSLASVLPFSTLLFFGIGCGLMLGGIFRSLKNLSDKLEEGSA